MTYISVVSLLKNISHCRSNQYRQHLLYFSGKRYHYRSYKSKNSIVGYMANLLNPPNCPPPVIKIQVVGNGGVGNGKCIYLFTDNNRYLFNCGEGAQRISNELKVKLTKVENVFLTRTTWDKFGGLPGLSMALKGIGTKNLTVHGPSDLIDLYGMTRFFGVDTQLSINQFDYNEGPFKDTVMEVHKINLHKNLISPVKKSRTTSEHDVCCYVCHFHDKPGELIIKKCIELKIPRGPLLGKLKNGNDVTLDDGRTILSKDVVGEPEKGPILFIIDCPTKDYMETLFASDVIADFQKKCMDTVSAAVHFAPGSVVLSESYKKFISKFSSRTFHIYINEESSTLGCVSAFELQAKLNLLDPEMFPLPSQSQPKNKTSPENKFIGEELILRPTSSAGFVADSGVRDYDKTSSVREALDVCDFTAAIEKYKQVCSSLNKDSNESRYPEFIFLGTGSATPSKYRNSSCILVKIDDETTFMLDCGEGSFGQFFRFFGDDFFSELQKLKGIYVSHHHADHHLALIELLKNRESLGLPPLPLIIPPAVRDWLQAYSDKYESIDHLFKSYLSTSFQSPNTCKSLWSQLNIENLVTVKVPHCKDSLGLIFHVGKERSYKIVYSGDTMQSPALIREGMNCDVLIHEATMDDGLEEDAIIKRHCTMSQAIDVGRRMNAKNTILTHFSQRYHKIPLISFSDMGNVGIAFDNMRIRYCDLPKLPHLIEPLKILFHESHEDLLEKRSLRLRKQQIRAEVTQKMDSLL